MPATAAIGTDLAYSSITKLAGTWQHWRQGTVDVRVVRALAIGSVPATLVAVAILFFLHSVDATAVDAVLERFIGVMLIVAAALMLRKLWRSTRGTAEPLPEHLVIYPTGKLIAIGAFGGFLVGLTSIGSGSLIIALAGDYDLADAGEAGRHRCGACLPAGGAAAMAHFFVLSDVDVALAGKLLIGSIPGVLIGSRLTVWVPRRPLAGGAGRVAPDDGGLPAALASLPQVLGFAVGSVNPPFAPMPWRDARDAVREETFPCTRRRRHPRPRR